MNPEIKHDALTFVAPVSVYVRPAPQDGQRVFHLLMTDRQSSLYLGSNGFETGPWSAAGVEAFTSDVHQGQLVGTLDLAHWPRRRGDGDHLQPLVADRAATLLHERVLGVLLYGTRYTPLASAPYFQLLLESACCVLTACIESAGAAEIHRLWPYVVPGLTGLTGDYVTAAAPSPTGLTAVVSRLRQTGVAPLVALANRLAMEGALNEAAARLPAVPAPRAQVHL